MPSPASVAPGPPRLHYARFDPSPCHYPAPRVPLLPRCTAAALRALPSRSFEAIGAAGTRSSFSRGRYALWQAYRSCGIGPAGALLVPAYHCRTMLDPGLSLRSTPLLYRVDALLRPELAHIDALIRDSAVPVRALLLTHCFGFAQDAADWRRVCNDRGLKLIEDCSHAMINRRGHERLGIAGHFSAASPYKFFPCEEGGLLIAAADAPPTAPLEQRPAGWRAEAEVLDLARSRRRDRDLSTPALAAAVEALLRDPGASGIERLNEHGEPSTLYAPADEQRAGTHAGRAIAALCQVDHLALARRANYRRWLDAVAGLPGCRALFGELPDDTVPYMFPLVVDDAAPRFHLLKRLGLPIWRWDDMAQGGCAVANAYRLSVWHLPCHQSLDNTEMTWMMAALSEVFRRRP